MYNNECQVFFFFLMESVLIEVNNLLNTKFEVLVCMNTSGL